MFRLPATQQPWIRTTAPVRPSWTPRPSNKLPDDPDDLLRQLQVLAAQGGGDPSSTIINVDGFQNGSALPPKGSIASIRVNPDRFSSQYYFPPFSGGLIEIFTKPGADSLHGALFYTGSDAPFNANDAFSTNATSASKQRYGFELSGPIFPKKQAAAKRPRHRTQKYT